MSSEQALVGSDRGLLWRDHIRESGVGTGSPQDRGHPGMEAGLSEGCRAGSQSPAQQVVWTFGRQGVVPLLIPTPSTAQVGGAPWW